jgi:hypothetical protein
MFSQPNYKPLDLPSPVLKRAIERRKLGSTSLLPSAEHPAEITAEQNVPNYQFRTLKQVESARRGFQHEHSTTATAAGGCVHVLV